ncbi:MAG: lmo0937 family membrane protein [Patescibacteria group bacterium]
MLSTIAIILLVLWLVGFIGFPTVGGLVHLLLVAAVIVFAVRLIQGRRVI